MKGQACEADDSAALEFEVCMTRCVLVVVCCSTLLLGSTACSPADDVTAPAGAREPRTMPVREYVWPPPSGGCGIERKLFVLLRWDSERKQTVRRVGTTTYVEDGKFIDRVRQWHDDVLTLLRETAPCVLEAEPDVPWRDVVATIELCRSVESTEVLFDFSNLEQGQAKR